MPRHLDASLLSLLDAFDRPARNETPSWSGSCREISKFACCQGYKTNEAECKPNKKNRYSLKALSQATAPAFLDAHTTRHLLFRLIKANSHCEPNQRYFSMISMCLSLPYSSRHLSPLKSIKQGASNIRSHGKSYSKLRDEENLHCFRIALNSATISGWML